jgi:hypothetical protein
MDSNFLPEPTCASVWLPETSSVLSTVMALLDIARLEIDADPFVAKASIVRASALLRHFANFADAPTSAANARR